jgi:hypothetical protein
MGETYELKLLFTELIRLTKSELFMDESQLL